MADGSSSIIIAGFPDSSKVPMFAGETNFASGPINLQSIQITVLLCGLKTSAGSMTVDQDVVDCQSAPDADTLAGAGSELARMAKACFRNGNGFRLKLVAPALNGSAVAGTLTITIASNASSVGFFRYLMCGLTIDVTIPSGSTPTQAAVLIIAAINAQTDLPWTATNSAGVITLTAKCPSIRNNLLMVYQDVNYKPGTQTSAVTGGAAVLSSTSGQTGCYFTGGAGAEDLTNVLAVTLSTRYQRSAWAQNDTTNLGLLEPQIDAKAAPGEEKTEHPVIGHNGTSGAATSIGQTTLNNPRFQLLWMQNCQVPPCEFAAGMAGLRAATEQTKPNSAYDGVELKGIPPHRYNGYIPSTTIQQTCLDNSVTPLTSDGSKTTIVRSICTRSLNGSTPDYQCLDTSDSWVPDYIRDDTKLWWDTDFKPNNPYVQPDPVAGEKPATVGSATPRLFAAKLYGRMLTHQENDLVVQAGLEANRPKAAYNTVARRLMAEVLVVVKPHNHSVGVKFNQSQPIAA